MGLALCSALHFSSMALPELPEFVVNVFVNVFVVIFLPGSIVLKLFEGAGPCLSGSLL